MRPLTAQMLLEEGGVRFTMDHDQELKYQMGLATTPKVFHYRLWLMIIANEMAEAAGMPKPYVYLEGILEEDTGERFLYDYFREQQEREQKFDYTGGMMYCPCDICERRRQTCACDSCTAWRQMKEGFAGQPLAKFLCENKDQAVARLDAAALEARRTLEPDSTRQDDDRRDRRSKQLEAFARMVRGGTIDLVLTHAPKTDIDVAAIVGFEPEISTEETSGPVVLTAAPLLRGNSVVSSAPSFYASRNNTSTSTLPNNISNYSSTNNTSATSASSTSSTSANNNNNNNNNNNSSNNNTLNDQSALQPPKKRFRPERFVKNPQCPKCSCRPKPIKELNIERRLLGQAPITGKAAQCMPECEQAKYLAEQRTFSSIYLIPLHRKFSQSLPRPLHSRQSPSPTCVWH